MSDACNYCGTLVGVGSDYMCCDCSLAWRAGFNHPSRLAWVERAKQAEAQVRAVLDLCEPYPVWSTEVRRVIAEQIGVSP